jgi:hypothetical protein
MSIQIGSLRTFHKERNIMEKDPFDFKLSEIKEIIKKIGGTSSVAKIIDGRLKVTSPDNIKIKTIPPITELNLKQEISIFEIIQLIETLRDKKGGIEALMNGELIVTIGHLPVWKEMKLGGVHDLKTPKVITKNSGNLTLNVNVSMEDIRKETDKRLNSTGGRMALEGATRRQKIPLRDDDWDRLNKLKEIFKNDKKQPTAGQIASVILNIILNKNKKQ